MRSRRRRRQRRVLVLVFGVGIVLLLQTFAWADTDIFQNVGPEPQVVDGLADKYPLGHYDLDTHVDGVTASVTGGVDTSDLPAAIAGFLAGWLWKLTAFLANAVISLLTFAFSLDLVNGSPATGGAGALQPISDATRNIYEHTFGAEWMIVGVLLAAFWAMWRALVQRRFSEVAGAFALSLIFAVIALAFVLRPDLTVGEGSKWSNRMSAAVLSISKTGEPSTEQEAKRAASDQVFKLLVHDPWVVLNFGGTEHCVKSGGGDDPESVAVRPLAAQPGRDAQLRRDLAAGTQVSADRKTCINNGRKYAAHFLRWSPGDLKRSNDDDVDERDTDTKSAYAALRWGDADKLADADPEKSRAQFGPEDRPAADQMQAGGQFGRLVMAIVIFVGELGAILLLGALSIGVILAQVIVLLLLAFAPVVLVLAILPGRGHQVFLGWLARMGTFLLRKFLYSLVIAVLLAIGAALTTASANLGWFMAFGLQATFFWAIFFYRKELVQQVNSAITGTPGAGGDVLRRLQGAYYGGMMLRRPAGALAGAAVAPVALPAAVIAAQQAKKRSARRAEQATRRAADDRQDLADRISNNLRPPQTDDRATPPGDGPAVPPDDGTPRTDPARGPNVSLLRRYPAGPRAPDAGDAGRNTSTTNGTNATTDRDPSRPDQRRDPATPGGDRPGPTPRPPGPSGHTPAGDARPGNGRGGPPARDKPLSLTDSLADDEARIRELREQREANRRADEAERPKPPARRPLPRPRFTGRPPRRDDDDRGRPPRRDDEDRE